MNTKDYVVLRQEDGPALGPWVVVGTYEDKGMAQEDALELFSQSGLTHAVAKVEVVYR